MSATDLRFSTRLPVTTDLRFGIAPGSPGSYITAGMAASVTVGIAAALHARTGYLGTVAAAVDVGFEANLTTAYDNAVNRGPHAWQRAAWETTRPRPLDVAARHDVAPRREANVAMPLLPGKHRRAEVASAWGWMSMDPRPEAHLPWREAAPLAAEVAAPHAELSRTNRPALFSPWGEATPRHAEAAAAWIDRLRHRRPELHLLWAEARRAGLTLAQAFDVGRPIRLDTRIPWQEARRPLPGVSVVIVIPPVHVPCYNPIPGEPVILRFKDLAPASLDLRFHCPNWTPPGAGTVVIPILRSYIVHNDILLKRTDNNLVLPALALSLSIDADSWCWGWSASLPAAHLGNVLPANGQAPVEFEAVINGVHWLLLGEKVRRDRRFGSDRIALSGRGIAAELGAPYASAVSRSNTADLTAQQIMDAALQINGVGIGWGINWGLVDWLVPAGVWNHSGSHIEAIARVAEAGGGYIQASRTAKTLNILPRYPVLPWEWASSVVPDFSLPAAVTTTESVEWQDNPAWNAVYVSGAQAGILAQVKRQGTAGDLAAPMIVDALNTHADAARQRGAAVLATAGRSLRQTLETPVLPGVGIYPVGSFVEFVDGATTRLGIVRGVSVNANLPVVRQTIEVECHA